MGQTVTRPILRTAVGTPQLGLDVVGAGITNVHQLDPFSSHSNVSLLRINANTNITIIGWAPSYFQL